MQKIFWSFCGILLCVPMFSFAQEAETLPVAEPALFEFAGEDEMPTAEPVMLESEADNAAMDSEPIELEAVEVAPGMTIEMIDDGVEISDEMLPDMYRDYPMDELPLERMSGMNGDENYEAMMDDVVAGVIGGVVVLVFYILFPGISITLLILAARKNWSMKKKKEKSVGYAGFWKRVAIKVFDKLINVAIVPIFFSLYYYFRDGQTIGDKVFGAKIVDKKSHEIASVGKLFMRFIAKLPSCLALGIGYWPAGWRKEKNAWHDSLSDTRYISTKKVNGFWIVLTIALTTIIPLVLISYFSFQSYVEMAAQQGVL